MGFAGGRVDHGLLEVGDLECLEDGLEAAFLLPSREALVDDDPRASARREVAPLGPGRGDPEDGVEEGPLVAAACPCGPAGGV